MPALLARASLAAGVAVALWLVVLPVGRHHARPAETWGVAAPADDGLTARGVRHARVGAGLTASAAEIHVERARVGPFRLGFARTLTAREVRIDLDDTTAAAAPPTSSTPTPPSRASRAAITAVHIDGLHLRLAAAGGTPLEVTAGRCSATLVGAGRVVCDRTVRVQGPGLTRTFDRLTYDPAGRRFLAGRAPEDQHAVARMNALLGRSALPDLDTLRTTLGALS